MVWLLLAIATAAPAQAFQSAQSSKPTASFTDLQARASTAREAGKLDQALALYRKAMAIKPDWDEGRWYVAALLYELDRYSEARDAFSEVLRRQPKHAEALALRGLCQFQLQRYENALVDLLQATAIGVFRLPAIAAAVRYHAAILLTRLGDFEVANQMLAEFAGERNDMPQAIEALGINALRMPVLPAEMRPEARERVMLAGRAAYAMAARHTDAARAAFDDLVARYPNTPHAHYARGVFLLTEDAERAMEDFRRELEISPSHVPARLQIAFEFLKRGDPEGARAAASEAVKLAPDHFATRLALGQVLLERDDPNAAIGELEAAAKLAPESPQTQFILARAYARVGRTTDAERARAEFARLDSIARATRHGQQSVGGIPTAGVKR